MLSHGEHHESRINEVANASSCGDPLPSPAQPGQFSPPSTSHRANWTRGGHSGPPPISLPPQMEGLCAEIVSGTAPNALCHTNSKFLPEGELKLSKYSRLFFKSGRKKNRS